MFRNVGDAVTPLASSVTPSSCHLLLKEKEKGNAVYFGEGDKESDGIRNFVGVRWKEIETLPKFDKNQLSGFLFVKHQATA